MAIKPHIRSPITVTTTTVVTIDLSADFVQFVLYNSGSNPIRVLNSNDPSSSNYFTIPAGDTVGVDNHVGEGITHFIATGGSSTLEILGIPRKGVS